MLHKKILLSEAAIDDTPVVIDANVKFLCHFDQNPPINAATNGAGTVVNAGYYRTQVITNDPASAKFGQGYLLHGGTVGGGASEYVTFPKGFSFGTNNFTIDSWHLWNAYGSANGAQQYGWEFGLNTSNNYCGLNLSGTRYNGGMQLTVNRGFNGVPAATINIPGLSSLLPTTAYFHVAIVRDGSVIRVYTNGILRNSQNIGAIAITEGTLLKFGVSSNAYQPGCATDEVRIVMDQVLYTDDFTPPTAPFPNPII